MIRGSSFTIHLILIFLARTLTTLSSPSPTSFEVMLLTTLSRLGPNITTTCQLYWSFTSIPFFFLYHRLMRLLDILIKSSNLLANPIYIIQLKLTQPLNPPIYLFSFLLLFIFRVRYFSSYSKHSINIIIGSCKKKKKNPIQRTSYRTYSV